MMKFSYRSTRSSLTNRNLNNLATQLYMTHANRSRSKRRAQQISHFVRLSLETAAEGNFSGCGLSLINSEISRLRQLPASTSLNRASLSRDRVRVESLSECGRLSMPNRGPTLRIPGTESSTITWRYPALSGSEKDEPITILSGQILYDSHSHSERP